MQYITQLGIDYLSTLDYVDLTNLCRTSKQLANICLDNTYLRRILTNVNPSIYLPPNIDIASAMNQLNTEVELLFSKNYPPNQRHPVWVNRELFRDYMKRLIYTEIYHVLIFYIYRDIKLHSANVEQVFNKDITLELNKPTLAFPFTAYQASKDYFLDPELENAAIVANIENKIRLPTQFVNYIKYPMLHWYEMGGRRARNMEIGLRDLLFLKQT